MLIAARVPAAPLDVRYIGSKACSGCHRAIYEKYIRTAMGQSVSKPATELLAEPVQLHDAALNRDYRVFRRGNALFQSESEQRDGKIVFETEHQLEFRIGAGQNGISFAVRRADHLFQAPLSYYAAAKRWDFSPGFEQTSPGFNRPILEACIVCHAGRPNAVPHSEGRYLDPPFSELAIGCENCHGPGELHLRERSRGPGKLPDTSIVNPRRVPARLAEDICMQCHQAGDARVLMPAKSYADFRPGRPLAETVAIFALPSQAKDADLLEHHTAMKSSKCYRATNGKLSCLTCHNPHEQPDRAGAAEYFRGKCLNCHNEGSCRIDIAVRRKTTPADNCIGCHMPKRDVARISHSALTNHRIPARLGNNSRPDDLSGLVLVNQPPGDFRLPLMTRLAAYGELMTRAPALESKYFELLEEARRTEAEDPLLLAALGRRALLARAPEAAELLSKAEGKGPLGTVSYLDLSEALTRSGRTKDSTQALERGESAFPFSQEIRKRLILAYIRQKDYAKAKLALERYVQDFPEDGFMRGLLSQAQMPR